VLRELEESSIRAEEVNPTDLTKEETESLAPLNAAQESRIVRLHLPPGDAGRIALRKIVALAIFAPVSVERIKSINEQELAALRLPDLERMTAKDCAECLEPRQEDTPFWKRIGVNSKQARKQFVSKIKGGRRK
ncbi:MAG TPA: hypothetical protein VFT82_02535, partial [Candidatus Paceibacterota bacterium]|nr:hypothetical protein [Candidatus Paceibacterota bacterium]